VPDTVLAAYWSKCHGREEEAFGRALTDTVRRLREAGTRVWIVLDVPVQDFAPPRALAYHALRPGLFRDPSELAVTPAEHRERNAVMEALRAELEAAGARLLDPASLLFEGDGRARLAVGGEALYADGDHLTEAGARLLRPLLAPIFAP
jgi:lysophospholipase L1-like esterase